MPRWFIKPTVLSFSDCERDEEIPMKILHILNDGPTELSDSVIRAEAEDHEITIVDLSERAASYESIVDAIFTADKVVSW